jgi:DNA-binding GntR family transcriptional regulator
MIPAASLLLQKQNLSEQIFEVLKNLILAGELKPGERILEAQLATQLKVSRAPIREALLLLAQHGFVTIRPHRGAFVTELSAADLTEIFEIRQLLEVNAALKIHKNMTPDLARCLEAALAKIGQAAHERDVVQFTEADFNFHKTIWNLAGNTHIAQILTDIASRYFRYEQIRKTTLLPDFDYNEIFDDHRRLVDRVMHGSKKDVETEFNRHFEKFLHFAMMHFVEPDIASTTKSNGA